MDIPILNKIGVFLGSYFYVNMASFFDTTKQVKQYIKKSLKHKTIYQQGLDAEEYLLSLSGNR